VGAVEQTTIWDCRIVRRLRCDPGGNLFLSKWLVFTGRPGILNRQLVSSAAGGRPQLREHLALVCAELRAELIQISWCSNL